MFELLRKIIGLKADRIEDNIRTKRMDEAKENKSDGNAQQAS